MRLWFRIIIVITAFPLPAFQHSTANQVLLMPSSSSLPLSPNQELTASQKSHITNQVKAG